MALYAVGGNAPRIHPSTFVHPLASVIGRVEIGPNCYIGAGANLRGDWVTIRVGPGSNVQDSCTVHGSVGETVELAENSHLGHGCVIHGARLERDVLVGMNAVVLDGAVIGEGSIVASGCVVPGGLQVPPGMLVLGVPGRITGEVRPEMRRSNLAGIRWYQQLAERCLLDFKELDPEVCRGGWEGDIWGGPEHWATLFDELTADPGG
ncbi:MAG: gamma carbonic anhydrase family protein [Thermoleophilia bacterium]